LEERQRTHKALSGYMEIELEVSINGTGPAAKTVLRKIINWLSGTEFFFCMG